MTKSCKIISSGKVPYRHVISNAFSPHLFPFLCTCSERFTRSAVYQICLAGPVVCSDEYIGMRPGC